MTAGRPVEGTALDSLGKGTVVMVLGTLALLFLNFLGRVFAARRLSPDGFGDFNLGLSLAGLVALVALLGLHQAVARTLASHREPAVRRRVIRWAASITAVTSVVASVAVFFAAAPLATLFSGGGNASSLTLVFQLFAVSVGLTLLSTFVASVFQGFEDAVPNAWINQALQPGAFLVFVVAFFTLHLDLFGAVLAWVLSNGATFAALVLYAWKRLPRYLPPGPRDAPLPRGLLTLTFGLWGVTTLSFVTAYVDTLILGVYRPEVDVGVYSAVITLTRLILVAGVAVTFIFLPVAARLFSEGNMTTLRSVFVTATRWMLLLTLPMFLIFALMPGDSIETVFGHAYESGALALAIVAAGSLISVAVGPVNAALAGMAETRPLLISTGVSAGANVVLSLVLIPPYGLIGAAVAWTVARVLFPAVGALALWGEHGVHVWHPHLVRPTALALAIGLPLVYVIDLVPHPDWLVFPVYFVGVGIYLASLLLTRTLEEGDLALHRLAERMLGRPLPGFQRFLVRFMAAPPAGQSGVP